MTPPDNHSHWMRPALLTLGGALVLLLIVVGLRVTGRDNQGAPPSEATGGDVTTTIPTTTDQSNDTTVTTLGSGATQTTSGEESSVDSQAAKTSALCDAWAIRESNVPTDLPYSPADFERSLIVEREFYTTAAQILDSPEADLFTEVADYYAAQYTHFEPYGFDSSSEEYYLTEIVEKGGREVPAAPVAASLDAYDLVQTRCGVTITRESP